MSHSLTLLLVALFGLTAIFATFKARGQLSKAHDREGKLRHFVREQSTAIRTLARESLQLRRQHRQLTGEIERLTNDFGALKEKIQEAEHIDRRLYVLDDRRTPADQEFIIGILHPNYKGHASTNATPALSLSWMKGRRYIVWAVDKDRALDKINARLPKEQGYVIHSVVKQEPGA